jgi:hypothetical protein
MRAVLLILFGPVLISSSAFAAANFDIEVRGPAPVVQDDEGRILLAGKTSSTPAANSQPQQCVDAHGRPCQPPAPAAVPVRPQVVQPQQLQIRPGQQIPNQRAGNALALARPGIVRGPSGALRKVMPANIVHNPRHMAGRAGARYNRQAFLFRRGKHFYHRAYYVGSDGGTFFYDEVVPDGDPSLNLAAANSLPTCPEDSDDCQGFNDPVPNTAQQPTLVNNTPESNALQFLVSLRSDIPWQNEGITFDFENGNGPQVVPYSNLEVTVNHYFPFGAGPEQLFVGTSGLLGTGYRIYSGSYDQNKPQWDKAIVALRALGVRAATPTGADRDIRSVQ